MEHTIHRLFLPIEFPEGIAPGEGRAGNLLILARDGQGRAVLRGTALAGALRHAWARLKGVRANDDAVTDWFGYPLEGHTREDWNPSPLRVPDCLIDEGRVAVQTRTHNAINRHTGAVLGKGLFSIQTLPPKSRVNVCLWLHVESTTDAESHAFLAQLVGIVQAGLTLGGHAARGIGRAVLAGPAKYRIFHAAILDEQAAWLDENRGWRNGKAPDSGEELAPPPSATPHRLIVGLELGIASSEDLLVGDGQGLDYEIEPQRVTCSGDPSRPRWKLPGSAMRGILRAWFTRLAARAGEPVADSHAMFVEKGKTLDGNDLAWGFDDTETRKRKQARLQEDPDQFDDLITCPIMRLFGSSYSRGRIHVGDAISVGPLDTRDEQVRAHVAVDRITGGANEGFFFQNTVMTGNVGFKTTISMDNPSEQEVRWLISSLRALHVGILRVGTSKASGRLRLSKPPEAAGCKSELFDNFSMSEV